MAKARLCCAANLGTLRRYSWKDLDRQRRRVWMKSGSLPARWRRTQAPTLEECEEYRASSTLFRNVVDGLRGGLYMLTYHGIVQEHDFSGRGGDTY